MMRRPAPARAFTELNRAVMENHGRVTSELKRLVGHVASTTAGYRCCEAHTIRAAQASTAAAGWRRATGARASMSPERSPRPAARRPRSAAGATPPWR